MKEAMDLVPAPKQGPEFCHFCGKEAYKTDHLHAICEKRAYSGSCHGYAPAKSSKVAQNNDPCPCGSGKKYKKCCKP